MNYTYSLEKLKNIGGNLVVKEFYDGEMETWHFMDLLIISGDETIPEPDNESFRRCKRWLIENHPELAL